MARGERQGRGGHQSRVYQRQGIGRDGPKFFPSCGGISLYVHNGTYLLTRCVDLRSSLRSGTNVDGVLRRACTNLLTRCVNLRSSTFFCGLLSSTRKHLLTRCPIGLLSSAHHRTLHGATTVALHGFRCCALANDAFSCLLCGNGASHYDAADHDVRGATTSHFHAAGRVGGFFAGWICRDGKHSIRGRAASTKPAVSASYRRQPPFSI